MKRDMELVRTILIAVQGLPPGQLTDDLKIEGYDPAVIAEHVELLVEAGLLDAEMPETIGIPVPTYYVRRLTWNGHDFLELALNNTAWNRLKASLGHQAVTISFDLMKQTLTAIVAKTLRDSLGLP